MKFQLLRVIFFVIPFLMSMAAQAQQIKIVAMGDSLMAGFGLARNEGFVPQLQARLDAEGYDVEIVNAGVSGDTTSGGRSRLAWSVGADASGVILELGANDMLRGLPVEAARNNLDAMVAALKQRNLPVLLAGMRAAPNLGPAYRRAFDAIYPDLAKKHNVLLYPFFLDGVAGNLSLNQADGIHPTKEGIAVIVNKILPSVKQLIDQIEG